MGHSYVLISLKSIGHVSVIFIIVVILLAIQLKHFGRQPLHSGQADNYGVYTYFCRISIVQPSLDSIILAANYIFQHLKIIAIGRASIHLYIKNYQINQIYVYLHFYDVCYHSLRRF